MIRAWMPLYVADYLAHTGHLSTIEHGAYMLLIMHYWTTGGLPDDDELLARIAKMTKLEWKRARPILAPLFMPGWRHKRVDAEIAATVSRTTRRTEAGTAAAEKRWGAAADRKTRAQRLSEARGKGTHTESEWVTFTSVFNRCVRCKTPADELVGNKLCKDHIIPIYQGGDDTIENLQPVCRECNSIKSQEVVDYREKCMPGWREMYAKRMRNVCEMQPQSQSQRKIYPGKEQSSEIVDLDTGEVSAAADPQPLVVNVGRLRR